MVSKEYFGTARALLRIARNMTDQTIALRLVGIPAKAVRNAPPELAYDVDLLEEYRYAVALAV